MKSHPVPQNIMDVEFKLFGELTVRQFGYVAGGASIAFVCYIIFNGLDIVRWPLVVFFAILGLMLALFKVNDRPFEVWLANFIYAMFTSQRKVWKKSNKIPNILSSKEIKRESNGVTSSINKAPLSSVYTSTVESNKNNVDLEEQNNLAALDSLFQNTNNTNNLNVINNESKLNDVKENIEANVEKKVEIVKDINEYKLPKGENPFLEDFKTGETVGAEKLGSTTTTLNQNIQEQSKPFHEQVPQKIINNEPVISNETPNSQVVRKPEVRQAVDLDDILPEPKSREEMMKQYDNNQTENSNFIDLDIKSNEISNKQNTVNNQTQNDISNESVVNNGSEEYIKKLRMQLEEQNKMINNLRDKTSTVLNLEDKPVRLEPENTVKNIVEEKKQEGVIQNNILSGVVKNKDGKEISNVTIIVKDNKYRPVRAMKSNNQGKFATSTPLPSGEYVIEATKENISFDSINFNLDGVNPKYLEIFAN